MYASLKIVDLEIVEKYYQDLSKPFNENQSEFKTQENVVFKDDDIFINDISMRETAKNKFLIEKRITAMFKLLIPEQVDFDMDTVTYDQIEELFPFPIQLQLVDEITNTISASYKNIKGKSLDQSVGK
jgi:hypothetical protein